MKKIIKYVSCIVAVVVLGLLVACGGGGGGSDDVAPSVVVVPPVEEVPDEEVINGIVVPPAPDPVEDAASVGGVDTNGNIVRDSVERMLATEFGNDPVFYEQAKAYAIAEQVAIMDPTEENVAAFIDLIRCLEDGKVSDDLGKIDEITVDSSNRGKAYDEAFAGVTITYEGC